MMQGIQPRKYSTLRWPDNNNPVITSTHGDQTVDANESCEASLPDYTSIVTATDNCDSDLDIVQSPVPGTTIAGSTNTVTLTITDDAGNFSETTFNVAVVDSSEPIISSVHTDKTVSDEGSCQATLADYTVDVAASDNCDLNLDITQTPVAGTIITGYNNQVTLSATDNFGNKAEATFNVHVMDNTNPVISSTHIDQSLSVNENCEDILPDYTSDVVAADNCDIVPDVTQSPVAGSLISGSTNLITLTVSDDSGNTAEATFNVGAIDDTDPLIISTHNNDTLDANASYEAELPDYTLAFAATDNCDASLDILQAPVAGTIISGSTNPVTLTATDNSGNYSQVIFNAAVADLSSPIISSMHPNQFVSDEGNCEAILADYTGSVIATDVCDPSLDITQSPTAGTTINGLTNTVTLTATDDAGNAASTSFNVEVIDNTNPIITSTHNDQTLDANTNCQALLADYTGDLVATDNCDSDLEMIQNPVAGTIISSITNSVTLTVTDVSGNFAEVAFSVEVQDNANPIITSTHNNQTLNANTNCEALLPDYSGDVVATDNCNVILDITQSPVAGTTISGNTNEITLITTDDAGNSAETAFNVEVIDAEIPTITCTNNQNFDLTSGNSEYTVSGTGLDPVSTSDNYFVATVLNNFNNNVTLDGAKFSAGTTTVVWSVTDNTGNEAQCSCNVTVNESVGIEEIAKHGIFLYPNPTNGIVHFESTNTQIQNIKVYNLIGKLILDKTDLSNKKIDLSEFHSGIYIVNIRTNEESFIIRILKN